MATSSKHRTGQDLLFRSDGMSNDLHGRASSGTSTCNPSWHLGRRYTRTPVQQIILPALVAIPREYEIISIYDPFTEAVQRCQQLYNLQADTTSASIDALLHHPSIDRILNFLLPPEHQESIAIPALGAAKDILRQSPMSFSIPSARRIINAEKRDPTGKRHAQVFVSFPRNHARCVRETLKGEIANPDRVVYARCTGIVGSRRRFVSSTLSGMASTDGEVSLLSETFPDHNQPPPDGADNNNRLATFSAFLTKTGHHDLSTMRDLFGFPDSISGVVRNDPFYTAMFHYTDQNGADGGRKGNPFTVAWEGGVDCVPSWDSEMMVYGREKTLGVQFGKPLILPDGEDCLGGRKQKEVVRVVVESGTTQTSNDCGRMDEKNGEGGEEVKREELVCGGEDVYIEQFKTLHWCLTGASDGVDGDADTRGERRVGSSQDALMDLKLFRMIFAQYDRQCGTIRSPLS